MNIIALFYLFEANDDEGKNYELAQHQQKFLPPLCNTEDTTIAPKQMLFHTIKQLTHRTKCHPAVAFYFFLSELKVSLPESSLQVGFPESSGLSFCFGNAVWR